MTRLRTVITRLQQADGLRTALHRGGLAPAAGMAEHGRPRLLRRVGGAIPGAVVHHQDEIHPGQSGGPGHGSPNAVGFVPGGDDDSHVTARNHGLILVVCRDPLGRPRMPPRLLSGRARQRRKIVVDGENGRQAGHFQDLADGRARRGECEVTALLACLPVGSEQDVHPGRVAELDARHVHHDLGSWIRRPHGGEQLVLQPWGRVEVDLTSERHDGVLTLGPARHS